MSDAAFATFLVALMFVAGTLAAVVVGAMMHPVVGVIVWAAICLSAAISYGVSRA